MLFAELASQTQSDTDLSCSVLAVQSRVIAVQSAFDTIQTQLTATNQYIQDQISTLDMAIQGVRNEIHAVSSYVQEQSAKLCVSAQDAETRLERVNALQLTKISEVCTTTEALDERISVLAAVLANKTAHTDGCYQETANYVSSVGAHTQQKLGMITMMLGEVQRAFVTTADATETAILTLTPVDGTAVRVLAEIMAHKADGTQAAYYRVTALARRAADVTTVIGTPSKADVFEDDELWDVAVAADDEDLVISVTGVAETDIHWSVRCYIERQPIAV